MRRFNLFQKAVLATLCFTIWFNYLLSNSSQTPDSKETSLCTKNGCKTKHISTPESQSSKTQENLEKSSSTECSKWCKNGNHKRPPYFLTAIIQFRIYADDKAQLTTRDLVQWIQYMRFAGAEHIYAYDTYVYRNESQRDALSDVIDSGFVTYTDWNHHAFPHTLTGTVERAYADCQTRWGNLSQWQTSIDMDEYPFSPNDTQPGFLARFVHNFSDQNPQVSEISMQNFLFLGKPQNINDHPMLIDRIWRTPDPANNLVKPIYKPLNVKIKIHHNVVQRGKQLDAPVDQLRMNHYWGARLQDWGEDTPEIIDKTVQDLSMKHIDQQMQNCEDCLGTVI